VSGTTVTVVGDVLLDRDVLGTVSRVSPDAPVPVVDVADEVVRAGGAGLAATLLAAHGADVTLVAGVGNDEAGDVIRRLLRERGVRLVELSTHGGTREKVRVRAHGQSLVRLDRGSTGTVAAGPAPDVDEALAAASAVLVADYAGGVPSDDRVRLLLQRAAHARPTLWDPHRKGAAPVRGCRLVTPNDDEALALAAGADDQHEADARRRLAVLGRAADALREQWAANAVSVTMGGAGALLTYGSGAPLVVPADPVDAHDTCGAGDRFAAAAAAALAGGALVSEAVAVAVREASSFVAAGGAAGLAPVAPAGSPPSDGDPLASLRARGTLVATGGCFDLLHAGHVELLRAARSLGDALVVAVNSDDSVRRLKGAGRPLVPVADRVRVLEALECVDAVVVFDDDTPERVITSIRPHVWAKGGDYALGDLPEADVVARLGGQAVVLPYLQGRSTTALIGAATARAGMEGAHT
jgi:D-beta-D-heptose 7-phosphate kinase / D-beta-D-heptose 1-phosphate adenosyltransferase